MDEIITLKDFTERYKCTRFAVYNLVKSGMPYMRPAGKYLFSIAKIEEWMSESTQEKEVK